MRSRSRWTAFAAGTAPPPARARASRISAPRGRQRLLLESADGGPRSCRRPLQRARHLRLSVAVQPPAGAAPSGQVPAREIAGPPLLLPVPALPTSVTRVCREVTKPYASSSRFRHGLRLEDNGHGAAVCAPCGAGDVARPIRAEERHNGGDLGGLGHAARGGRVPRPRAPAPGLARATGDLLGEPAGPPRPGKRRTRADGVARIPSFAYTSATRRDSDSTAAFMTGSRHAGRGRLPRSS